MLRSILSFLTLAASALLVVSCQTIESSGEFPTGPRNDEPGRSPNTIHFTVDGTGYTVDVLTPATSFASTGVTGISGSTRPGAPTGIYLGLEFKLTKAGTTKLSNTGSWDTDDQIALVMGNKTYQVSYDECVDNRSVIRYTDLGTVIVESADRVNHRIRGSFGGTIALETDEDEVCGGIVSKRIKLYPIIGHFDCDWYMN